MAFLLSNEILNAISKELKKAKESVQIISAFCKEDTIRYLSKDISSGVKEKRILIRFRLDDLISGSTDFSVLDFCIENGWDAYIRFDLHAKTYIVDHKRGINTSANATNRGLSIGRSGNVELGTLIDVEPQDIEKIDKLFCDAIQVNETVLGKLKEQYDFAREDLLPHKAYTWSEEILGMFSPDINTLFSYELPDTSEIKNSLYLGFLDLVVQNDNISEIKKTFRWSNSYLWLLSTLKNNDGCMYFGALTKALHDSVISDPKPYRREIKEMLVNLLAIIEQLGMDEVCIDVPNYSQRVRLQDICY